MALGNFWEAPSLLRAPDNTAQGEDLGWAWLVITITTAEEPGVWEPGWELGVRVSHPPCHHSQGAI